MIGIYKITSPSGRIYIGQSRNIDKRFSKYKNINNSKEQIKLYKSFNKYGIKNHIFETVEECLFEELNIRERYYQDFYDVLNSGLNCILTKTNILPTIYSQETKDKLSKASKGRKLPKETKLKISESKIGKKLSEEHKLKLSNYHKNKKLSPSHCLKIKQRLKEKHPCSRKIINFRTGEIFETIKIASFSINMKSNTLVCKLNGRNKNDTDMMYFEEYKKLIRNG